MQALASTYQLLSLMAIIASTLRFSPRLARYAGLLAAAGRGALDVEDLGAQQIRGRDEPVRVYRLAGPCRSAALPGTRRA